MKTLLSHSVEVKEGWCRAYGCLSLFPAAGLTGAATLSSCLHHAAGRITAPGEKGGTGTEGKVPT